MALTGTSGAAPHLDSSEQGEEEFSADTRRRLPRVSVRVCKSHCWAKPHLHTWGTSKQVRGKKIFEKFLYCHNSKIGYLKLHWKAGKCVSFGMLLLKVSMSAAQNNVLREEKSCSFKSHLAKKSGNMPFLRASMPNIWYMTKLCLLITVEINSCSLEP